MRKNKVQRYEFRCPSCQHGFSRRCKIKGTTSCPKCGVRFIRTKGQVREGEATIVRQEVLLAKKQMIAKKAIYRATKKDYAHEWLKSKEFLKSDEWRTIRYQALKLHGAACQCCGRTAAHGIVLHVDHIKPRSLYPHLALELSNLQVLCEDCNLGKSNIDDTDWRFDREESDKALARHDELNDEFRGIIAGMWHKHTPIA